jgi:molybdopterin converting factor small subunit
MKITFRYTSQLSTAAGTSEETLEFPEETSLIGLLGQVCMKHGPEFSKFVLNQEGAPVKTLVVALDGTQVDLAMDPCVESGSEVYLITPMSGG